jgi:exodeoxyribonuclease V gamma subunit
MFTLSVANRTETLMKGVVSTIETEPQESLFAPELFLIQSQGMERMIAQYLADRFGVFCNFRFFLPLDFLAHVGACIGLGLGAAGFQRQVLTWRLDELLRHLEGEVYLPLQRYLQGEDGPLKRFQLARQLADVFDQYQVQRSEMLDCWERGQMITGHGAEAWQMSLWRRLAVEGAESMHRGRLLRRISEKLGQGSDLSSQLPRRIFILGLHTMPPLFLECLDKLSRHMEVHLLLLSPSRHYWGDVESDRVRLRRQARELQASTAPLEHHPLLAALGRQGRDFHNMLLQGVEELNEIEGYEEPADDVTYRAASLLHRVQIDLLEDRLPPLPFVGKDDSLRVVSCHSRLRELQVLKEHLLHLLHRDHGLELRHIVVMAPDIQDYADLIPAVFADIQHSIADRSTRRRNPFLAAFLAFLDLFTGRFGWSEVVDVLRRSEIFPQFELSEGDLDTLEQWVADVGIRWGLSLDQRSGDGHAAFGEGSWRYGIERMLLGFAMADEHPWEGVLPFAEIEGQGARPLGGLCRYISLIERAWEEFRSERPLTAWSELLGDYARQLLGDGDDRGLAELRAILAEPLETLAGLHHGAVTFAVVRHWLALSAAERRSSSGFLRGRLTFCSMLPMRSVPFKAICLLGLNDGEFPRPDRYHTFNLMANDHRPGDRSPRSDDRYQFLEALLSARSHLHLSYVGQSIRTNEELYPSTVLGELLEILEEHYQVKDLVVVHPLQPFSSRYFMGGEASRLFSHDVHFCAVAQALQRPPSPARRWWQGRLPRQDGAELALADVLRFFRHPQRYFLGDVLGIAEERDLEPPEDSELFACHGLDLYEVEQEVLQKGLGQAEGGELEQFTAAGRWPLGTPGTLAFAEKSREISDYLEIIKRLNLGERLSGEPIDLLVGDYRLLGTLPARHQGGGLLMRYGRLRGSDLLGAWLWHAVALRVFPDLVTHLVTPEERVTFSASTPGPSLQVLLELFVEGRCRPLPLLLEPALAYARQAESLSARSTPLSKAVKIYEERLEKGYEPAWAILYGEVAAEEILDEEFEDLSRDLLSPLWRCVHGG